MLKLTRLSGTLILSGSLLVGLSSCRGTPKVTSPTAQAPVVAEQVAPKPAPSLTPADPYALAIDKADSATTISQSAQSQDDWNLVISRWQQALQLMKAVPKNSPNHTQAKTKIAEFERNLTVARQQVARIANPPAASSAAIDLSPRPFVLVPSNSASPAPAPVPATAARAPSSPGVYQARIKRRAAGTPVIDVTFNGNQTFEMIVDTGASGTVITEPMATALGAQIVGKAKVSTASDRNVEVPLVDIDSMSVGGAVVRRVRVAIGQALEIGLLGHDFFSEYDVTIKRDVVEFRLR
jgi:gag-polyprotein putative aspartyl protease